ncbi:MAG: FAD-dependent oxidoreductase [Bacteroidota bacterium]
MKLPYIFTIDDDTQVLGAIQRDLRNKYRSDYRIVATESANEALELLKDLKLKNEAVALLVTDQRMPEMEGVVFLEKAREIFPDAKQVLLTAYSDTNAAIQAINTVKLDYYLLKPWSPPEEKLYPVLDDLLDDWQALYKPDHEGIKILGFQWSPKSHEVKEFLAGNLVPFQWIDAEHNENAEQYLTSANITKDKLPLIIFKDGSFTADPSLSEIASRVGLRQQAVDKMYDVLIVGAGPAGLAASVYGSCEGLKTLLIEQNRPGGQAGTSARIENYLGFPTGLSGAELTRRAITQTLRFGTEMLTPQNVDTIRVQDGYKIIQFKDGSVVHSKAVLISTGVQYNRLDVDDIERFSGAGVYYGSAAVEAHACKGQIVYIVGSGNSSCQAALYLSKFAKEVHLLIRKEQLKQTAAYYLVDLITKTANVIVHGNTEVVAVAGGQGLETITLKHNKTGEQQTVATKALFVYIGARPSTSWLNDLVLKDEKGFILTGKELEKDKSFNTLWKLEREPLLTEASVPGIFASGDVRASAMTGVSSAVGEGAMAIRFVRKYLHEV